MADYTLSAKATMDASGFTKGVSTVQSSLKSMQSACNSIGGSLQTVGTKLTNSITKPAIAAATALGGLTIVKGFQRLEAIDTAKAKLSALGNSAEDVKVIMDSATTSVKGTAYGLDAAATTAASAVAAGIKPGQDLTRYLSLTADAAAVAGVSMDQMGSVFNKVQTSQAAYTEELNQLADAGIPIYQWLGEEAGLSAAEVKEMASEGAISSETFLAAIEKNIGGAAKVMGESSFSGALANVGAALSRVGANFLDAGGQGGGFFSQLKPLMADFTEQLGVMESKAAEWGQTVGGVFSGVVQYFRDGAINMDGMSASAQNFLTQIQPALDIIKRLADAFMSLSPAAQGGLVAAVVSAGPVISVLGKVFSAVGTISGAISGLSGLFGGVGAAGAAAGTTATGGLAGIASAALPIVGIIAGVIAAFVAMYSTSQTFRDAISGVLGVVGGLFQQFGSILQNIASTVGPPLLECITAIGDALGGTIQALLPGISAALSSIMGVLSSVAGIIAGVIAQVLPVITSIIQALAPVLAQIASVVSQVFEAIAPLIDQLVAQLAPVIQQIVDVVMQVVNTVAPIVTAVLSAIGSAIQALMPIIQAILSVIASVLSVVITVITTILSVVVSVISTIIGVITNIVSFIASAFGNIASTVGGAISNVVSFVTTGFQNAADAVSGAVENITSFVQNLGSDISNTFNNIVSTIGNAVQNAWDTAVNAFNGMVSGITGACSGIYDAVQSGFSSAIDYITSLPGQALQWGADIINSIADGIRGAIGAVSDAASSAASAVADFLHFSEPDVGPLSNFHTFMPDMIDLMASGINAGIPTIAKAAGAAASAIADPLGDGTDITASGSFSSTVRTQQDISGGLTAADIYGAVSNAIAERGDTTIVLDSGKLVGAISGKMNKALGNYNRVRGQAF